MFWPQTDMPLLPSPPGGCICTFRYSRHPVLPMAGKGAFRGTFVIGRSAIKRPQIRRVGNIIGLFTRLTQRFRLQFPMGIVMLSFARTPFPGISCQKTTPTHPIRGHFLPTRYDAPPPREERAMLLSRSSARNPCTRVAPRRAKDFQGQWPL